jgi:hypothetical protein
MAVKFPGEAKFIEVFTATLMADNWPFQEEAKLHFYARLD